jgi:hypothetical protein
MNKGNSQIKKLLRLASELDGTDENVRIRYDPSHARRRDSWSARSTVASSSSSALQPPYPRVRLAQAGDARVLLERSSCEPFDSRASAAAISCTRSQNLLGNGDLFAGHDGLVPVCARPAQASRLCDFGSHPATPQLRRRLRAPANPFLSRTLSGPTHMLQRADRRPR